MTCLFSIPLHFSRLFFMLISNQNKFPTRIIIRFILPDSYAILFSLTSSWRIVRFEISPQCHIYGTSLHARHGCNLSWASISVAETTDFSYTVHFCSASRDSALYFVETTEVLHLSCVSRAGFGAHISVINRGLDQHRMLMLRDRLGKNKLQEMCNCYEFYVQSSWNIRIIGKSYASVHPSSSPCLI
jgi:hypothetical protein